MWAECDEKRRDSPKCLNNETGGVQMYFIPYDEMIIYKLHVRGYTMQNGSKVKNKGTFLGLQEKISYWKELGVTTIELMPAYDFADFPENYWGYTSGDYFSPKPEYCKTEQPEQEVKDFIEKLHAQGLECLMDFYFPKDCTSEFVLEVLQFWKKKYEIDGFVVSGEGVCFELLAKDEVLAETKLLCAGCDWNQIYKKAPKVKYLAEYNANFQNGMRRFLRGDREQMHGVLYFQKENPQTHAKVQYMANHDGFTLADLVSYDYRHNEDNGEYNLDGIRDNFSWNCGVEGPTKRKSVLDLRKRQMRNAMMLLLLSQGTPLILAGDEFGNSQKGNNNAYCQDNEVGWTDWRKSKGNEEFTQFVKALIQFRMAHPILHLPRQIQGSDAKGYGYPEVSYHSELAWYADLTPTSRHLGVLYCGFYAEKEDQTKDDFIYILYNMNEQEKQFALPKLPKEMKWYLALDSGRDVKEAILPEGKEELLEEAKYVTVDGRSIVVLLGK